MKSISKLAAILLISAVAVGQQSAVEGTWSATAGSQMLSGSWTAQISRQTPNAAHGTWAVTQLNRVLMDGTWSARKSGQGWTGTWSARTSQGRSFSGRWSANMRAVNAKSFAEMLRQTAQKEISGAWESGGSAGNWWLRSSSSEERPR